MPQAVHILLQHLRPYTAAITGRRVYAAIRFTYNAGIVLGAATLTVTAAIALASIIGLLLFIVVFESLDTGSRWICIFDLQTLVSKQSVPDGEPWRNIPHVTREASWWDQAKPLVQCIISADPKPP